MKDDFSSNNTKVRAYFNERLSRAKNWKKIYNRDASIIHIVFTFKILIFCPLNVAIESDYYNSVAGKLNSKPKTQSPTRQRNKRQIQSQMARKILSFPTRKHTTQKQLR